MSYLLGFQTKYIWNPWGIPVHPAQLVLLYLSTILDSRLAHCDIQSKPSEIKGKEPQCANQESNKVERYSKTNCAGWTGMPQGFQIYFVWNPRKSDMKGPYKLLPAEQAWFGNLASSASRSLYGPSMSYLLGFQTKYIWNPWGIPVHPAQVHQCFLQVR